MATVAELGFACGYRFSLRLPFLHIIPKARLCSVAAVETDAKPSENPIKENYALQSVSSSGGGGENAPKWKKLSSKDLGITKSLIDRPTRVVLNGLKRKGFEVYLVGGCVRDFCLKRTPKDFDVITSAELIEVKRSFPRCEIVGKRFPICHVHVDDTIVEVSSFSTHVTNSYKDMSFAFERTVDFDKKDYIRWRNCLQRDFTINGLMFDPYENLVYDYKGGVEDIRKTKVRTMIPANLSFLEDCARILRAIRIAARLGFRFTREIAYSIKNLSHSVLRLDKGRLLMEMNYMLAYGSAEASLRLLWKFGLLEILLPIQAAYFVRHGFTRRDKRSNMLLSLFSKMDKLLAPDRPCHRSLWVGILAFHKALSDQPKDPLVVAAFSLAVHNGGDMSEALNIASRISIPHDDIFHELLVPQNLDSDALAGEVMDLAASVKGALTSMTDESSVSRAMAGYTKAPYSDLVFIPLELYLRVSKIFECVTAGKERRFMSKQGSKIDYEMLALGMLPEVRHVFARIVFDTVFPINPSPENSIF